MTNAANDSNEVGRIGRLAVFWVPYLAIPWLTGWTFASNIECAFCWDDLLRHAFSLFGYGTIGCVFFASTAKDKSAETFRARLWGALLLNSCFFISSILVSAEWGVILL